MNATTIAHLRRVAIERLRPISETPALDADLLLGAALGLERAALLAGQDRPVDQRAQARCAELIARAAAGEPIAYLLGRRGFYDRDLIVTPAVLIPRPETELLLEQALAWTADRPAVRAADIGTGCGALAVTFAAHRPESMVWAVDLSAGALAVARRNAEASGVTVHFTQGDLLTPLIERALRFDLLMANLPYIPSAELPTLAVSRHEPRLALDGGPDGLALIRRLLAQVPSVCAPGALLLLEIGAGQGDAVSALAAALQPQSVAVLRDYAGHDRIVRIAL